MDLSRYPPFALVVFAPTRGPFSFHHQAGGLTTRIGLTCPLSSSGKRAHEVQEHRRNAFQRLVAVHGRQLPLDAMRQFHRGEGTEAGPLSVAMSRPGRGTVSVTEVEVSPERVKMTYYGGHPSVSGLNGSETAMTLERSSETSGDDVPRAVPENVFSLLELFEEKNPALRRKIPDFALNLLGKVLGTSQFNAALAKVGEVSPSAFAERGLTSLQVQARVPGPVPVLDEGAPAPIYVANHPLGGIDGLAMLALVQLIHGRVVAPVNDILLRIPHARSFGVGIDKSRLTKGLAHAVERTFRTDAPVLIFPAGKTSRKNQGQLEDGPWGRMVVRQALRYQRPIVPVFVTGENSPLFYRVAQVRSRLGIGANLEMFLLPREVLRPHTSTVELIVGTTIFPDKLLELADNDEARAAVLRACCYSLNPDGVRA
jgi:putative hemolysin